MLIKDILEEQQLNSLYNNFIIRRNNIIDQRDKVVLGLIIYQGLNIGDIEVLQLDDVNLQVGAIKIKERSITNERVLKLEVNQILDFNRYVRNTYLKLKRLNPDYALEKI